MQIMFLMCGNVGVGKSHLARKIARREGGIIVSMDDISSGCHGGEGDRYDSNFRDIYHAAEKALIAKAADLDVPVIIDRTNINAASRQRYIRYWQKRGGSVMAINMGPGDDDSLHRRVLNGKGVPKDTWRDVHNSNLDRWEPPCIDEGIIEVIDHQDVQYRYWAFDFDGTIVVDRFPQVGEVRPATIEYMRLLDEDPRNVLIVWTSRTKNYLWEAREFLIRSNTPFDYLNENPLFLPNSQKIYYDTYVTNKSVVHPDKLIDDYYRYEAALHE